MANKTSSNNRIAKNTLFLYIRMAFVLLVSLYTTRVVLHSLGASDYGIFNVVCGFVTLFGFLNTSMTNAIQRFYNYEIGKNDGKDLTRVYNSALIVQVVISILVLVIIETFGLWYLNNKIVIPVERLFSANIIFQSAVIQLFFAIISVPFSAIIIAKERMDFYAIVSILDVILKLVIVILLPYTSYDKLQIYGLLLTAVGILNFLLYYIYVKKNFSCIIFCKVQDYSIIRSILSFSGWNIFGTFAFLLKNQGLAIVLNVVFGTIINAAYGISNQVMGAIKQFSLNIIMAFKPQLVQSYAAGNYTKTRHFMYAMTKVSYIMLYAISLPVIIEMDNILKLWLTNVPEHTVILTRLAIISMLLSNFHTPLVQVIHAVGKQKLFQIITSSIIFGIVPVSYCVLKLDAEPEYIYWVTIALVMLNQLACLFALRKEFYFSIKEYIRCAIAPCVIVTMTSIIPPCFLIYQIPSSPIGEIISITITSIISVIICFYLFALTKPEKKQIKEIVIKKINKIAK